MEHPILFSTPMVKAILEDRKSMTRRVMKPQPGDHPGDNGYLASILERCPYGKPGDTLWIRETWGNWSYDNPESNATYYQYKADYPEGAKTYMYDNEHECDLPKWHPSIHMPREAARLFLMVKNIRVERLHDITEEDAKAEGVQPIVDASLNLVSNGYRLMFSDLWNSINFKRGYGWDKNTYVWVVEFERK